MVCTYTKITQVYWLQLQHSVCNWIQSCILPTCVVRKLDILGRWVCGNGYSRCYVHVFVAKTSTLWDKTAFSVGDMVIEWWILSFGFPIAIHKHQSRGFDNTMTQDLAYCGVYTQPKLPLGVNIFIPIANNQPHPLPPPLLWLDWETQSIVQHHIYLHIILLLQRYKVLQGLQLVVV
jgi:hypothetical protein